MRNKKEEEKGHKKEKAQKKRKAIKKRRPKKEKNERKREKGQCYYPLPHLCFKVAL